MTFKHTSIEHTRNAKEEEWIAEEAAEQELRFKNIQQAMKDLSTQREKWYQEFFDRISTRGFNEDGDQKIQIAPEDLPTKPEGREDQVVWRCGADDE
ncbi:MAG: hypothetical protein F4W90_01930 [Gammaproteobacteria bacterium]|nr:hypothetical protein [Gammaproteobacteria bacterium]